MQFVRIKPKDDIVRLINLSQIASMDVLENRITVIRMSNGEAYLFYRSLSEVKMLLGLS